MSIKDSFNKLSLPAKGLMAFLTLTLGLSFFFAPQPKPIDWDNISFSTTSSSLLYFKNVRSYYYNISPDEKAPFVLYRLKRRIRDSSRHYLQFIIVNNPLQDEAYLFAELSPVSKKYPALSVRFNNNEVFELPALLKNEDHYRLGAKVFNHLINNEKMYLCSGPDTLTELFAEKKTNLSAEIILEDYFKLTDKQ